MTVTADQLREAMVHVSDLEQKVSNIVNRPLPAKFPVNFDANVSAIFVMPDMAQQTPTWVNGGPDFWCSGIDYSVMMTTEAGTVKLHDTGNGLGYAGDQTGGPVTNNPISLRCFDFRWNVTKMSNARGTLFTYLTAPGSIDSLLSRQALGNRETGRALRFSPWKIERGDSVFFTIKPLGYFYGRSGLRYASAARFTVMMNMYGFRDQAQRAVP